MSSTPPEPRPRDDSKVASIAWAVAAVVVALSVAFIAWLATGDDGNSTAGAPTRTSAEEPPVQDETAPAPAEGEAASDPTAQTPPPEVEEMLLSLQRRDADDVLAVGDVDAPVVMIEYADYRCPYCARFHLETRPELMPLVEDGTLRIEFRDLVLFGETSELAAVASRAAGEQGHLGDFQEAVFELSDEGHGEYGAEEMLQIAEEVGVPDLAAFEEALGDEELLAAVQADTVEARSIGLQSTPTFLVNTQVIQGAYPAPHLIAVVEAEAERATEDA